MVEAVWTERFNEISHGFLRCGVDEVTVRATDYGKPLLLSNDVAHR
jgi:hypothetical protein